MNPLILFFVLAFDIQMGLSLVNNVRYALGIKPLRLSPVLNKSAQRYAEVMARYGELGHSVDSTHFEDRIKAAGYNGNTLAENVAEGYDSIISAVKGWISSAGHYKNLVNPSYTEVGFGMARSRDGNLYWCQDFGNGDTSNATPQEIYTPKKHPKNTYKHTQAPLKYNDNKEVDEKPKIKNSYLKKAPVKADYFDPNSLSPANQLKTAFVAFVVMVLFY